MWQEKRHISTLIFITFITLITLQACNIPGAGDSGLTVEERAQTAIGGTVAAEQIIKTSVAGTLAASGQSSVIEGGSSMDEPMTPGQAPTETPNPTITMTPTITLTPTLGKATVTVSRSTNCRSGPGTEYDILGVMSEGEQTEVVGTFTEWNYWIIKNPDKAGECWLWGEYATVVGPTANLPKYNQPPTPTPEYNWTGTWTTSHGIPSTPHETIVLTLTQTGSTVSGSFNFGPDIVTLSGSLSADKRTLTGTWTSLPTSGPFCFYMVSMNQFTGNRNDRTCEWCGYRAGAGLPSPCMGP